MNYLKSYLDTVRSRGNIQLAESIEKTASDVSDMYLKKFTFIEHNIGLLFGNVQSGKTGQMFGIISAAADSGFPAFLLLTTDNVVLQQQTVERVRSDLPGFLICDEYDTETFTDNNLEKCVIIVLKKNSRILKQWANVFANTGFMTGNPLFIIDDEADAASLNTLVNRNGNSAVNKYLSAIKNNASSSIYLQVTGTPQALFLQSVMSGWHPMFTYYFEPGKGYLGGDFFFPAAEIPGCISYIDSESNPVRKAVMHHLLCSAQIMQSGGNVCNFLIHPGVKKSVHSSFKSAVKNELDWCRTNIDDSSFEDEMKKIYSDMKPVKTKLLDFSVLLGKIKEILENDEVKVLVMNTDSKVTSDLYDTGSNIVIGGNTLGRGVTFPGLQTLYYTREAKKPQADTMWQHSRMFGYDRDGGMIKVFITSQLYKLFSDINAENNSLIAQAEKGFESIKISYPEGIAPTRKNVIDTSKAAIISGGTNYYPFNPRNNSIDDIDKLLANFDDNVPSYQINLRLAAEIFKHIDSDSDFDVNMFVSFINALLAEKPAVQGMMIVRRGRNIAKGTGALLSPNDWKLGASFKDKVVLTMYKVTGEKGWNGEQLWIPNIRFPDGRVYYSITDE
ncbi:MAG: Z1 domain-containing protein [Ruminococcus sp.]|nr:Z1 domain-containing protein [Ruminococcus sp.]MCM1381605.1 Z1 domain-containing protein [Muribaculaceae bacterium]MCM1479925.1 Z1 domain-containing protein [Muribaculaceae bacterium]